jgi:glycerophosphoryl diester phosphodiesterase
MWPFPKILAHRGGGKLAPENTIAALRCGLERGYRAVEFDVMLARDNIPVVMHDPYLGRTVPGSGNVYDYDAGELQAMNAGAWFGKGFDQETVPLFTDFAAFCLAHGIWMNVEIKPAPGFDAITGEVVARTTSQLCSREQVLLSSFSEAALAAAQAAAPELPRAILFDQIPPDWQARARKLGVVAIHCNHKRLDAALAAAIRSAGFGLFCYTVNTPERARELLAIGVEAFCTDRIDLIAPDFAG